VKGKSEPQIHTDENGRKMKEERREVRVVDSQLLEEGRERKRRVGHMVAGQGNVPRDAEGRQGLWA